MEDSSNRVLYSCENCDFKTFDSNSITRHKNVKTGSTNHFCQKCPLKFCTIGSLMFHVADEHQNKPEKTFNCKECKFGPCSAKVLEHHKKMNHTKNEEKMAAPPPKPKIQTYTCTKCDNTFLQKNELELHNCSKKFKNDLTEKPASLQIVQTKAKVLMPKNQNGNVPGYQVPKPQNSNLGPQPAKKAKVLLPKTREFSPEKSSESDSSVSEESPPPPAKKLKVSKYTM